MSLANSPSSSLKRRPHPSSPTSPIQKINSRRIPINPEDELSDDEDFYVQSPSSLPQQTYHALSYISQAESGKYPTLLLIKT